MLRRLLLVLALALPLAAQQPRPLSDVERDAAVLAAAYLAEGPPALWRALTPDAPLRKLQEADALRELAVRAGPAAGATWTLETVASSQDAAFHIVHRSGFEEGLLFRMRGGRLHELRTLAEPAVRPAVPSTTRKPPGRAFLLLAGGVLLILAAFLRSKLRYVPVALAALAVTGAAVLTFAPKREAERLPFAELRGLLPLREALAAGGRAVIPAGVNAEAREVATLWLLRSGEMVSVTGTAADPLSSFRFASATPLAELVRGRVALTAGRERDARAAFERAVKLPPLRDDVLREAALSIGGDYPRQRQAAGSRDAGVWYTAASRLAAGAKMAEAETAFRTAWTLRPAMREELVHEPALAAMLDERKLRPFVGFYESSEPMVRVPELGARPMALPPCAQAFTSGAFLRIAVLCGPPSRLSLSTLEIPNGASLAPSNAQLVAATQWEADRDAAALRDAAELLQQPPRVFGPQVERAAEALADHNRWSDLLTLTNGIRPDSHDVPPGMLVFRTIALLRADRLEDARALAKGPAVRRLMHLRDAHTLMLLGDALGSFGAHDDAIALFRAAETEETELIVATRIHELELRRKLASEAQTLATANFDIRHDAAINPAIASRIGDLFEAELARLRQTFPLAAFRRTAVNVLSWDNFVTGITGSDHIVGLYDGEIILPFAGVERFRREVVAILTHELTHALVAQATRDNAPRWFQEGVAQRAEIVPIQDNVFNGPAEDLIPLPLLDAVMENAVDAKSLGAGYATSLTFIHFLESAYGADAPLRLATEFAKGANGDDALRALTGKNADALDAEFRAWGAVHPDDFATGERFPYDHWYSPEIDPRIKAGFRFTREQ